MPAVPLVPDLNIWPPLILALVSAAGAGALVGLLERATQRRRTRAAKERAEVLPMPTRSQAGPLPRPDHHRRLARRIRLHTPPSQTLHRHRTSPGYRRAMLIGRSREVRS